MQNISPLFPSFNSLSKTRSALILSAGIAMLATSFPASAVDIALPLQDPLGVVPPSLKAAGHDAWNAVLPCASRSGESQKLSLADAVDLALCNNSQVKSSWAAIKIQAASLGEAEAAYLPTVSGSISQMRTRTSYPGSPVASSEHSGKMVNGSLTWRLLDFGGREANSEAARSLLAAATASHDAAIQKTLQAVIQAYFDAQTAKAVLEARTENESIAASTLETAKRLESRGAASRSDTLQASTAFAKAALERSRALGDYQKALSGLSYVMGFSQQQVIILAEVRGNKVDEDIKTLDAWLEYAKKSHPAIVSARAQLDAAKSKVTAVRSEGLPSLDFTSSFYQNGYPNQGLSTTESRNASYGVALNIPLFDGFSRSYKVRGAQAQVEQKESELLEAERSTLTDIVRIYADASSAFRNLQFSDQLLTAAKDSFNASKRRYEKGAADISELLRAQASVADATQDRIRGESDWRGARGRLFAINKIINPN